jgi:TatD DNase family protein
LFDTHCHLNLDTYFPDVELAIQDARKAGVERILIPGVNLKTSKKAVRITGDYEGVYCSVGIHPTEKVQEKEIEKLIYQLEELCENSDRVVGVGEIGLDYYHLNLEPSIQKTLFKEQIKLALKLDKAIIIHSRHAAKDLILILKEVGLEKFSGRTVFHCCEPNQELLDVAIKNKIFIGCDGDVTYDPTKAEFIKKVPLDNLVLETDSPFLTPEPVRSHNNGINNNKPQNLTYIAKYIADIKKIDLTIIQKQTLQNSLKLFGIEE